MSFLDKWKSFTGDEKWNVGCWGVSTALWLSSGLMGMSGSAAPALYSVAVPLAVSGACLTAAGTFYTTAKLKAERRAQNGGQSTEDNQNQNQNIKTRFRDRWKVFDKNEKKWIKRDLGTSIGLMAFFGAATIAAAASGAPAFSVASLAVGVLAHVATASEMRQTLKAEAESRIIEQNKKSNQNEKSRTNTRSRDNTKSKAYALDLHPQTLEEVKSKRKDKTPAVEEVSAKTAKTETKTDQVKISADMVKDFISNLNDEQK